MRLVKDALKSLFSHKKALVFSLVIGLAVSLFADNYRWVGGTDNLWETLDNWEVYDDTIPDWVAATALPGESDEVDLQTNTVETLLAAVSVSKITGSTGSSLTFNGTGDQSLTLAADSTIPSLIFSGTGDQSIVTAGDLTVGTLNLSKSGGGGFSTSGAGKITVSTGFDIELDSAESVVLDNEFDITGFNLVQAKSTVFNKNVVVAADAIADTSTSGNLEFNAGGTVNATQILVSGNIIISGTEAVSFPNGVQLDSPVQIKDTASIETTDFTVNSTLNLAAAGTSVTATGDVLVNSTGTVTNKGTLSADGAITNSAGSITNSTGGTISTDSDFLNDGGTLTNTGTITVGRIFDNTGGSLTNNGTLTVTSLFDNNSGTLINPGTLSIGTKYSSNGGTLQNSGSLTTTDDFENSFGSTTNTGTITVGGNFDNTNSGSLANNDSLYVKGNFLDTDGTVTGIGSIVLNGTSQSFSPNTGTAYSKIIVSSGTALSFSDAVEIKNFVHNSGNITFTGAASITDSIGGTENTGTLTFNDTLTTGCASSFKNTGLTTLSGAVTLGGNASFAGDVKTSADISGSGTLSFQNISVTDSVVISGTQVSVASGKTITATTAGKNLTLRASGGTISTGQIGTAGTKFNTVELDTGSTALSFTSEDVHASSIKLTSTGNVSVTGIDYDGELVFNTAAKVSLNGGTGGLKAAKLTYSTTPSSYEVSGDIEITGTSGIVFDKAVVLKGDTLLKTSGTNAPVTIENGISGSYALEINNEGLLTIDDKTSLTDTGTADVSVSSFKQSGTGNVNIAGDITASSTIDFSSGTFSLTGDVLLSGTTTKFSSAVTLGTSGLYELTVNGTLNNTAAVTANVNVNAKGSVTSDGNWTGTKSLIFNGTGNQTFTVSSDSTYKDVKIEKSSGNLTTAGSGKATFTSLGINSGASSVITFNNETALANINLTKASKTIFNKDTTISAASIDSTNSGDIEFNGGGKVLVSVIEAGGTVKVTGSSKLSFPNGLTAKSNVTVTGELETTDLEIDGSTFVNSGTVTATGDVSSNNILSNSGTLSVGGDLTSSGTLTNGGTGTLSVTGDITSSRVFINNGTTTAGSDFTNTSSGTLTNGGDLTITGNLSNSGSSSISNSGDIVLNGNLTNDLGSSIANSDTISLKGNFMDSGTYTGNGTVIFNGTTQSFTPNASTSYAKITSSSSTKLTVQDNANIKTFTHNSGNLEFIKPLTVTTSYTGSTDTGTVTFYDTVTTTCAATFSNTGLTTFTYPATFGGNVSFAGDVQLSGNLTSSGTVSFQNLTVTDSVEISGTQITAASGKVIGTSAATGTKNLTLKASGGTITAGQIGTSTNKFNIVELDTGSHDINFTSETIYANQIKFTSSGNVTVTGITYDGDLIFNTSGKVSINGGTGGFNVKNIVLQTTPSSFELSGNIEITGTGGISFPKAVVLTGNTSLKTSGTNAPVTFSSGISGAYTLDVNNAGLLTIDDKTSLTDTSNADVNITSFTQSGAGAVSIAGDITCSGAIQFNAANFALTGDVLLTGTVVSFTSALALSASTYELSTAGKLQCYGAVTANVNVNALGDVVANGNWTGAKSLIFKGTANQTFNPKTGTTYTNVQILKTGGTFVCSRANGDTGTTGVTITNVNIDSSNSTITFGFDKNFSSSAFTIANCKALVFNNTVSLTTLTVDKTDSITTNGTTSITNISDTTNSGTYTFNNGVSFANNVTLNSTKLVTFKGTSNIGAAGSRKDFTHTNGITNINDTFNAKDVSLGAMTSTTDVTIDAHDITIAGTLTTDEKLTVNNGNNITVTGAITTGGQVNITAALLTAGGNITTKDIALFNCNVATNGNISFTNNKYVKFADGKSFTYNGNFTQVNGTGTADKSFMIGGDFVTTGNSNAVFASNLAYYGNNGSYQFGSSTGSGTGTVSIAGNFIIGMTGTKNVTIKSNVSCKNYVLMAGTINLAAGKYISSTTGDIIIVGTNGIYEDASVTNSISEYEYPGSRGSTATSPSSAQYTIDSGFPDGSTLTALTGVMTFGNGAVLQVGQNFYANGTSLTGTSAWYIDLKKTSDSESCFAECYKTTVTNCTVRKHSGTMFTGGNDGGTTKDTFENDTQIMCDEGCSIANNCHNFDNTDFIILSAYTVRDNVIRVGFSHPVRNFNGELNGKKGSGSTVTDANTLNILSGSGTNKKIIKYLAENNTETPFSAIYLDEECTTELTGDLVQYETENIGGVNKVVYYCYFKAPSSWATDATGTSSGAIGSTDRYGEEKNTAKPYIQIPRATAAFKFVVTDIYGKRLKNYKPGVTGQANYTAVTDKTAPSLYKVTTGQEDHADEAADQWSYDGHNYIEFRYSEPVDFNKTDGTAVANLGTDKVNATNPSTSLSQNILVTQDLGGIAETMTSDYEAGVTEEKITFIGLGTTAQGYISTGINGTRTTPTANNVNALYRKDVFSIRISIAGYTSGTVSGGFKKWVGYIESAKIPGGTVTQAYTDTQALTGYTDQYIYINKCVKDKNNNYLIIYNTSVDKTGTGGTPANANKAVSVTQNRWDLSAPEFSKVHKINQPLAESYFEAVGMGSGSVLDRIEIHITDNTGGDTFTDGTDIGYWFTSFGWSTNLGTSLANTNTYCADIFGGSNPYGGEGSFTKGGIRYSTIIGQQSNFKYCVGTGALSVPTTEFRSVEPGGQAPVFTGAAAERRPIPATMDNTYIKFFLDASDSNLSYDTTFTITYDAANSYITDLAGNRLRSISLSVTNMESIDRTSPEFDLVIAPVGSDEIYIQFVKQLSKQIVYQETPSDAAIHIPESFEEIIPYCFEIGTISGSSFTANTGTGLQIDTSTPAQIIQSHSNTSFTAVKLKLTRSVTLQDVETLYIRVTYARGLYNERSVDPFTSIANSYVTFIQDSLGNYMQMYSAHCISDFAVNVVKPSYAYDPDFVNTSGANIQDSLYEEGSQAVHSWSASQGNYGTLKAKDPVILLANITDGTAAGEAANKPESGNNIPANVRMYFSEYPTAFSQSAQYNLDLSKNLRIWVPGTVPVYGLSNVTNTNTTILDGVWDTTEGGLTFTFENADYSAWSSGNQITFLFGLESSPGTSINIIHSPVLSVSSSTFTYDVTSNPAPLYALRLDDPNDITSIDLWSFRVKDITPQRGGITIMNNVIDPTVGEKMVLNVNMKSEGDLSIIVMTLDGNVVTYLNRGSLSAGDYYFTWDGKNNNGNIVARGIYFIRIIGNGVDETRKVMIIKE